MCLRATSARSRCLNRDDVFAGHDPQPHWSLVMFLSDCRVSAIYLGQKPQYYDKDEGGIGNMEKSRLEWSNMITTRSRAHLRLGYGWSRRSSWVMKDHAADIGHGRSKSMRDLRIYWPVLGNSKIYLRVVLISRIRAHCESHGPPAKLKVGARKKCRRTRTRETPARGKGEWATQVEP